MRKPHPIFLILLIVVFVYLACAVLIARAEREEPQILLVQAMPDSGGVLISWDTYQQQALVFRRRFGAYDAFVEVTSGVTLHDSEGQSGDLYGVSAYSNDGATLVAEGAALAEFRVYLPGVGE